MPIPRFLSSVHAEYWSKKFRYTLQDSRYTLIVVFSSNG